MEPPPTPSARLEVQLRRTVDRLRSLGLPRLAASFAPEPTRAEAARGVAQLLADAAAGLDEAPSRTLPRLADQAVGDQLAVCGHDLLDAVSRCPDITRSDAVASTAADALLDLRRRL